MDQSPQGQGPQGFASEDEEATYCLSLLRDGDRHQKVVARERLSVIFEGKGMLDEAAQCLESNIREGVRDPRIYQRLAGVYRRQGRHELAEEVMVEARRLAERMARGPGPGQRRPGPGPPGRPMPPMPPPQQPILEAPTAQLPVSMPQPPVGLPQPPLAAAGPRQPAMPGDELELDRGGPPPGYGAPGLGFGGPPEDEQPSVGRPWWLSPAAVVLLILLCGPYGVAMFWVRGGYSKQTRVRVTAAWAGLMVLGLAGAAVSLQSQVVPMLMMAAGGGPMSPIRTVPTPIVFQPAPSTAAKPAAPQGQVPPPPTVNIPPGAIPPTRAPSAAEPPKPEGATPAPAEKPAAEKPSAEKPTAPAPAAAMKVKVKDTGGTGANLRDKPGQTGGVIKTIPEGEVLEVIGADQPMDGKTWKKVKDESGTEGWMAAELLDPA